MGKLDAYAKSSKLAAEVAEAHARRIADQTGIYREPVFAGPRGRVVVTRPLEDAVPLAERLKTEGFRVLIEPMLRVRMRPQTGIDLADVGVLLFTSANAVRAFAHAFVTAEDKAQASALSGQRMRAGDVMALPVWCVGDTTAAVAKAAGFTRVMSARGAGEDLVRRVLESAAEGELGEIPARVAAGTAVGGPVFLHVRGFDKAHDIAGGLARAGFSTREAVLYETLPAEALSTQLRAALDPARAYAPQDPEWLTGVLFFSPKSAETFVALAERAGVATGCRSVIAWCLSGAVAAAAAPLPWRRVVSAPAPDAEVLLGLLLHR